MPKHHRPDEPKRPPVQPPIVSFKWLSDEFEKLHHEHAIILESINDLRKLIIAGGTTGNLSPELSAALIETAKKVKAVDEKVPDTNVPPGINGPTKIPWGK